MDFKYAKRNRKLDYWVVIVLTVSLFFGFNFIISKVDLQFDLSRDKHYSLSPESLLHLKKIKEPVDIIVTIPSNNNLPKIVQRLLHDLDLLFDALERADSRMPIRIHRLDVNSPKLESKDLDVYKIHEPNLIVVASPRMGKSIIYRYKEAIGANPYDSSQVFRSAESIARQSIWEAGFYTDWKEVANGRLEPGTFRGEQTIIRHILEIAGQSKETQTAYFTRGHGEYSPTDVSSESGLSELGKLMEDRNLKVSTIDLSTVERLPIDAKLLVIAGPKGIFQDKEVSIIRNFMNHKGGRVLIALDPVEELTLTDRPALGLRPLLKEWGIRCHDMLIHDPKKENFDLFSGAYFLRTYPKGNPHILTANLAQEGFSILADRCRPIEVDGTNEKLFLPQELLYSSRDSWALSSWTERSAPLVKNPLLDIVGPVPVLAVSRPNPNALDQYGLNPHGKLAVLGCSKIFSNKKLKSGAGNQTLALNLIYWLQNENEMLTIPPRKIFNYHISMSAEDFKRSLYYFTAVPAFVLFVGLFVGWLRKEL